MNDHPDLIEDSPRMRRIQERERTTTDEHQEDDSLPDSISWNIRRGITPEQLEEEERSE